MQGLGERLRQRARELGLSDTEVARRLGLSQARYANYVSDKREPDFRTFLDICRILATTPDHLFGFEELAQPVGFSEPAAAFGNRPTDGEAMILRDRVRAAVEAMPAPMLRTAATVMDALVRVDAEE
jgi:transcriptional regulator with XRE-family HTH domain